MQLLTPSGYKNIDDCQIGEQLVAYDIFTGAIIINQLLDKVWFDYNQFEETYIPERETYDEDGNVVIIPEVRVTKKEAFENVHGELKGYLINNTWTLYKHQSVWANMNITHAQDLKVGDIMYDDSDNDIEIVSIQEVDLTGWWKLKVSGDHSYIADDLTLHNATRYWVGGGASANWNATGNTNWGSASGGANNASVPTSADDVIFDGAGTNGNTNSTISATITILSLNIQTGYTATMTHNAVLTIAGNFTFTGNYARAGSSGVTISAASTITSNGVTWNLPLTFGGSSSYTITLNGNLTVSGLVTFFTKIVFSTLTFTRTSSENFIFDGGIRLEQNNQTTGNVKFVLRGGSYIMGSPNFCVISSTTDIDGDITFQDFNFGTGTLTYISGNVTTIGSTIGFNGTTINTKGINWWNATLYNLGIGTIITLTSDMIVLNTLTGGGNQTFNRTTNETITVFNGINILQNSFKGTAEIIIKGGTITTFNTNTRGIGVNLTIDGNVNFANNILCFGHNLMFGGTILRYISGITNSDSCNLILDTAVATTLSFINIDKLPFRSITIRAGITVNMDRFFSGSDANICQITSTGANYTIAFTDGFEKIGKNVFISGATFTRPNQLLVLNNARFNTNRGTNVGGVRYKNESPNGFSKGLLQQRNIMTPSKMLVSDPNFLKQG